MAKKQLHAPRAAKDKKHGEETNGKDTNDGNNRMEFDALAEGLLGFGSGPRCLTHTPSAPLPRLKGEGY